MTKSRSLMRISILILLFSQFLTFQAFSQANKAQSTPFKDLHQGLELFRKERYNVAIKYFDRFIATYSADETAVAQGLIASAVFHKAACARKANQDAAERLLLDFIDQYPGHEDVYVATYFLGDFYFDNNNYKDAITYFGQTEPSALSKTERDNYNFKYAFSYFALKNFREARNRFKPLLANPASEHYYDASYYSGLSAYYLNDYKDAFKHFEKAQGSAKYKSQMPYYLSSIYFINKEYDELIAYAEPKLADRNLRYPAEIKKLLGNAYFEKGDFANAEKYLSEALTSLSKVNQEDYYQLGYVYYKTGNYNKSIENLKKLTFLDNAMVQHAMYVLGKSYSQIGDRANARNAFQQSARMKYNADLAEESQFNIAKLTYDMGNYTEALTLLRKFLDDYPKSKFSSDAQDILADVFLKTRNYEEALQLIEKMPSPTAAIKASYQKMAYFRATEYYSNNLLDKSDAYLDKALKYKSDQSIEALSYYFKADIAHTKAQFDASNEWLKKFSAIAGTISTDHSSRVSSGTGFYLQGYNSYKKKDFVSAQILFSKSVERLKTEKDPAIMQSVYPDAILRLADSYYMQRKYKEAIPHYNSIVSGKLRGADYATYQMAMLNGLTGNIGEKINGMRNVHKLYPNSAFADDALFELGATYTQQNNPTEAINTYLTLIQAYPKSEFVPYSYNRIGLLQYNLDRLNDALATYKFVVQKYPQTPASQEALIAVKDIYVTLGDPQGYFDLLKQYPGAMISTSAQDSIVYQAAEAQFIKGDYQKALTGFDSYAKSYPNGAFILPARFYRGECHNMTNNSNSAVVDYEFVIGQPTNRFTERSLLRASYIRFQQGDFNKSSMYYEALMDAAKTEDNQREAVLGAMRSYYKLNNFGKTIELSEKVIGVSGMSETVQIEATFYRGMSRMNRGEVAGATADLESVTKRINNEWAAQAKYSLASMAFKAGDLKKAETLCFEFIGTYPSYAEWMVRTYMLLSDIYVAQQQYFQAKATLQSVLDNFDSKDSLYKEAEQKYNKILEMEAQGSKLKAPAGASGFSDFEN
jgi:tetratricopeptide (TPR) repeat protein